MMRLSLTAYPRCRVRMGLIFPTPPNTVLNSNVPPVFPENADVPVL